MRPRISTISFLNTAPLMWDFERTPLGQQYEIAYTIPSSCAAALEAGKADIGLIPSVTYLTIPDLLVIPDIAIAARGAVRSILLVSKVPPEQVSSVATDVASRTSVALCRVLLKKWWRPGQPEPEFIPSEPQLDAMLSRSDAALIIGDSALRVRSSQHHIFDLAEEWQRFTGKPFVFAFWAVRAAAADSAMVAHFQQSRDHGLNPASLDVLAREWAPRVGISERAVRSYLTEAVHYRLDDASLSGLQLFWKYGSEAGILPAIRLLRFVEAGTEHSVPSATSAVSG
jgi:chorismate dehydratase